MARGCWSECEQFGVATDQNGWALVSHDDGSFDIFFQGAEQGTVHWELSGEHNRMNALAAIAAARHVGISPTQAITALAKFKNVKRRMELRGTVNHIAVYDDFATTPPRLQPPSQVCAKRWVRRAFWPCWNRVRTP
jgi:UDP-N-acetylmuramate: L-alanyl-gamma-D-glutamyl-meso-diaminopimelate ligase